MTQHVIFDGKHILIENRDLSPLAAEDVRVQLRLAGICSTDLALIRGYYGFRGVLGHEFVGDVIEGPAEWLGQRVAGEINIGCGECQDCQNGDPRHCLNRRVLGISGDYDGAFAECFRLPLSNLHRLPDTISDEQAVFVEPLAAAAQILEQIHIRPTDHVVVLGLGRLGMLVAQVLNNTGARITGIVRHQKQRDLLQGWGIAAASRDEIADNSVDIVVECTGNPEGFAIALELLRPRGTLLLKSTYEGMAEVDLSRVVVDEIRLLGSRCGPFDVAIRLLEQDRIDVQPLIEAQYPLHEAKQALEHAAQQGVLKVLLRP